MKILAIDPGTTQSAYVVIGEDLKPLKFDKIDNPELLKIISTIGGCYTAIEMIASYGMGVGQEVFDTCVWIGRFWERAPGEIQLVYRKDVKMNLCQTMQAKDSNVKQALIDRFAYGVSNHGKGRKDAPGWFYGFRADIWQAYAVGVTYYDLYLKEWCCGQQTQNNRPKERQSKRSR